MFCSMLPISLHTLWEHVGSSSIYGFLQTELLCMDCRCRCCRFSGFWTKKVVKFDAFLPQIGLCYPTETNIVLICGTKCCLYVDPA